MPNKVDSCGLIVSRDAVSPLLSSNRLWALQSLLQHEAYHLPECSAKTKSECKFVHGCTLDK